MRRVRRAEGNTNFSSMPTTETQRIYWCFTLNNPEDGELDTLLEGSEKYVYQLEAGDEEKTPHYQGFVKLKKRARFNTVKDLCPRAHIEATKGSAMDNYAYCTKRDGVLAGPWIKGYRKPVKNPLDGKTLRPFQQDILDLIDTEPDGRTIHWYWDANGNTGKSSLAKHICLTRSHQALYVGGKAADMKYAICKFLENVENDLQIVLIDIPRTAGQYLSYTGIEEIVNGIFFSGKYEATMQTFNPPHVICFANFMPAMENISLDRWDIVNIPAVEATRAPPS